MSEDILGGNGKLEVGGNGSPEHTIPELKKAETPPTDIKIAEIWVKNGQIHLDAAQLFWTDKCTSLGILEFCKQILMNTNPPQPDKPKIITKSNGVMDFVRNGLKKRK